MIMAAPRVKYFSFSIFTLVFLIETKYDREKVEKICNKAGIYFSFVVDNKGGVVELHFCGKQASYLL